MHFAYGTITPYGRAFQLLLLYMYLATLQPDCNPTTQGPTTPHMQRLQAYTYMVWALPRSLAATNGISVDFSSCRYLDVSIPCVRLVHLCIQCTISSKLDGLPHSEISGSKVVCHLPEAYRRLLRPSSPLTAKASTVCA